MALKIGTFTKQASTGNQSVTGVGFTLGTSGPTISREVVSRLAALSMLVCALAWSMSCAAQAERGSAREPPAAAPTAFAVLLSGGAVPRVVWIREFDGVSSIRAGRALGEKALLIGRDVRGSSMWIAEIDMEGRLVNEQRQQIGPDMVVCEPRSAVARGRATLIAGEEVRESAARRSTTGRDVFLALLDAPKSATY